MAREVSFVFNGDKMTTTVEDHWTLLHFIREDEMVEITPQSIRLRKVVLAASERHRLRNRK